MNIWFKMDFLIRIMPSVLWFSRMWYSKRLLLSWTCICRWPCRTLKRSICLRFSSKPNFSQPMWSIVSTKCFIQLSYSFELYHNLEIVYSCPILNRDLGIKPSTLTMCAQACTPRGSTTYFSVSHLISQSVAQSHLLRGHSATLIGCLCANHEEH